MKIYNWQQDDWPNFTYSLENVQDALLHFAEKVGRVSGILDSLPLSARQETIVDIILSEAIKTSAIEGEYPNREDVLSSIRKNLGLQIAEEPIKDKSALGLGELMADVRNSFKEKLTSEQLFSWHNMLMSENRRISTGTWRTHGDAMQVVSGALGKERIHFEAPPARDVPGAMITFLQWYNNTAPGEKAEIKKAPVRAAIAHLYFESIHPFEDGNGRIGRAIAEKALSQTIGRPVVLSLSRTIEAAKTDYYQALEKAQRSNEITPWLHYFVNTCLQAQTDAEDQIHFTLRKTKFFDNFREKMNERQLLVTKRMFAEGPAGFEGGMNARKYMGLTKTSKATATRDMQELLKMDAFKIAGAGGGRSTSYHLNI